MPIAEVMEGYPHTDPHDFDDRVWETEAADDPFGLAALPPCPGIPHTPDEIAASDNRARADIAAGRVYPHEEVAAWLRTWGSPDYRPFHEWQR